ncbi:hypothetical protein [Corynebacterium lowii]|uniref:ABC-2 type transporter n=1 Tax=Corynebacterium lowii TaxID=1544413 RepID=A0A0N8W0R6_9CORY|nr:hypothetical protein [Corynebacterium lowii]KQB87442.1 hypothetical protein Clow_00501 [Corynebacterium lowii]MDP9851966.1 ABC-2 type transport system permease protein [Corynebacterium lowii]
MMPLIRALYFHFRLFARTPYFVQLAVTSTVSIFVLQLLGARYAGVAEGELWLRSALVGMWAVSTVSAGIIGFQRFQGTLAYLLLGPYHPAKALFPLVAASSTFGLLAFPLAWVCAAISGAEMAYPGGAALLLGIVLCWVSCVSVSVVIAPLFVLTPNAITYEPLLNIPIVLLSGMVGYGAVSGEFAQAGKAIPIFWAARVLLDGDMASAPVACAVALAWGAVAVLLLNRMVHRATVRASLEVVG